MSWVLQAVLLILGVLALLALTTAIWRTLHNLFVKIINKFASSAWGIIGLVFIIWLAHTLCKH